MLNSIKRAGDLKLGAKVWLPDREIPDEYMTAVIVRIVENVVTLKLSEGKFVQLDLDDEAYTIYPCNDGEVDDLVSLRHVHLPGILHNIRQRSQGGKPYTFVGDDILVAVNPIRAIPEPRSLVGSRKAISVPHPCALAESAMLRLEFVANHGDGGVRWGIENRQTRSQLIVATGESGSGKTEAMRNVIQHLVKRGTSTAKRSNALYRLPQADHILESFGNALTRRNMNASRFGRITRFLYEKCDGTLSWRGASIETTFLERFRVTSHSPGERNFHIFYQLIAGADKELYDRLGFSDASFTYLKPTEGLDTDSDGSKTFPVPQKYRMLRLKSNQIPDMATTDEDNFYRLCNALSVFGIPNGSISQRIDQTDVFSIVAAILWLGNTSPEMMQANKQDGGIVSSQFAVSTVARLLSISEDLVSANLARKTIQVSGQRISVSQDSESIKSNVDSLARYLYSRLFKFLVTRISAPFVDESVTKHEPYMVVLFDSFGFSRCKRNDFSQLIMNYTNDVFEQAFQHFIIDSRIKACESEELMINECAQAKEEPDLRRSKFVCIKSWFESLATKPDAFAMDILDLIDMESHEKVSSDKNIVAVMHHIWEQFDGAKVSHPNECRNQFTVIHYAGEVQYTAHNFISDNLDAVSSEIARLLSSSASPFVRELCQDGFSASSRGHHNPKFSTTCGDYRVQLLELSNALARSNVHFIRCVKPNPLLIAANQEGMQWFNNAFVKAQFADMQLRRTVDMVKDAPSMCLSYEWFLRKYILVIPQRSLNLWRTFNGQSKQFMAAVFFAFELDTKYFRLGKSIALVDPEARSKIDEILICGETGKLTNRFAKRFQAYFVQNAWRRLFVKVICFKKFEKLLKERRHREGAATILQRLYIRRKLVLKAKLELKRLRIERCRQVRADAIHRATVSRDMKAALKTEKDNTTDSFTRSSLQEKMNLAEAKFTSEIDTAARIEAKAEHVEKQKLGLENKMRILESDAPDCAVDAPQKVLMMHLSRNLSGMLQSQEKESTVQRIAEKMNNPKNLDLKKDITLNDCMYRMEALFSSRSFSRLFRRRKSTSNSQADGWRKCNIAITGAQILYTDDQDDDSSLDCSYWCAVPLDPCATELVYSDEEYSECLGHFLEFILHKKKKRLYFKVADSAQKSIIIRAYENAALEYCKGEQLASFFFQKSSDTLPQELEAEIENYKVLFDSGLITAGECLSLIIQDTALESSIDFEDSSSYDATLDDCKMVCRNCGMIFFALPTMSTDELEKLSFCENCGDDLPLKAVLDRQWKPISSKPSIFPGLSRQSSISQHFPLRVKLSDSSTALIDYPKLVHTHSLLGGRNKYLFVFKMREVYGDGTDDEDWSFYGDWSDFQRIHSCVVDMCEHANNGSADKLPLFPEDVYHANKEKIMIANARLPRIAKWVFQLFQSCDKYKEIFTKPKVKRFFRIDAVGLETAASA